MKNRVLQFFDVPHSPTENRAPRATYIGRDDLYRSHTPQWVLNFFGNIKRLPNLKVYHVSRKGSTFEGCMTYISVFVVL